MSRHAIYVDDISLGSYGFIVEDVIDWQSMPETKQRTAKVYGRPGAVRASANPFEDTRKVGVVGVLKRASMANAVENLKIVRSLVTRTERRVRFADDATVETVCWCDIFRVVSTAPALRQRARRITMTFEALSGYSQSISDSVVGSITNSDTAIPLGVGPSRGVLRITGAATNPLVTYKNSAGTTLATLQLTGSIAGGDYVEINLDTLVLTKSVSGVLSSALSFLGSSFGQFFVTDPAHGSYATSAWPTLRVSSGTGQYTYRKAW